MKELNIYILLVMKWLFDPGSVSKEERRKNESNAEAASDESNAQLFGAVYCATTKAAMTGKTIAANAAYDAAFYACYDNYEKAEELVNEYFKITGENKQDYFDQINRELS